MLFALFLLVLVVGVMATLSLSHITHQKMELQVASDTAAYSQAVATARAFNSVALLNRAQVSTMVALAGVDSAVSFAGSYRAAVNATWYSYVNEFMAEYCDGRRPSQPLSEPRRLCEGNDYYPIGECQRAAHGMDAIDRQMCYGDACRVSLAVFGWGSNAATNNADDPNARLPLMYLELMRLKSVWNVLDEAAGLQGRNVQSEASAYDGLQTTALAQGRAAIAPFAAQSIAVAGGSVNAPSVAVASREASNAVGGGDTENSIEAAMGSRAHPFITTRADGARAIQARLRLVLGPSGGANEVTVNAMRGNGYFADTQTHGARPATSYAVWGDEECSVSVNYAGIDANLGLPATASGNLGFEGVVSSTDRQNVTDSHTWCPQDFRPESSPPDVRHTMLPHRQPPPGQPDPCAASSCIWPSFHDTNAGALTNPGDVYGQPKLFAAATKSLAGDHDPWNLFFTFRFAQNGNGSTTNLRAEHAVAGVVPQLQSLAAGMAYYHRPGHWKEPPNLFNPYWRATLVRANVDDSWRGDVGASISPSNNDTLSALLRVGYQGIP